MASTSKAVKETKKSEKKALIREFESKLIIAVKNHSCLYAKNHPAYNNKYERTSAWENIALILGRKVEECQKKWTMLRDSFRAYFRTNNDASSGAAASKYIKWIHFDSLKFLIPHIRIAEEKQKREIDNTGGMSCEWPPFQKIHTILGGFNESKSEVLTEEGFDEVDESEYKFSVPTSPENSAPPITSDVASSPRTSGTTRRAVKRRKKETTIESILKECKKTNSTIAEERNHILEVDTEMLNIERERNNILKEFVSNAKVFQDNLLYLLRKIN